MSNKLNIQMLTMGSAALIVSAGAMAAAPSSPVTPLTAHIPSLTFAIDNGGMTYDVNGELSGATCGGAAGVTCTLMDGSGDGMLQYLVKDTNTGKSHVELIVGSDDGDGLFLSDTFVRYNGAQSLNSMANQMVIKDPTELAAAGTGFSLTSTWLRGDYETFQPQAFTNATSNTPGTRMDSFVDMNIGGVQTFHAEGQSGENGDFSIGGIVDIQQGTTAANTSANAADAQAMGVFHTMTQGGTSSTAGPINYDVGASSITLGGQTLTFAATDGATATYIHQQGFGFNGNASDSYATDDPSQRDFAYINVHKITAGGGFPGIALGTYQDPESGELASTGHLAVTSQDDQTGNQVAALYEATTTAQNTAPQTGLTGAQTVTGVNDPSSAGVSGTFTTANVTAIQAAWSTIFGTSAQ